ncbi:MAG: PEP-CTERM sorting domain-containing protein [Terrimicrobiaceae bacterium]
MKTNSPKTQCFPAILVFAALALAFTGAAHAATIIYEDDFNRNGTLNGSTPVPVDTGGALWKDNGVFHTTSTALGGSVTSTAGSATLPFTPTSGFVYTLEADVIVNTASTNWASIGFSSSIDNSPSPTAGGAPTMLVRGAAFGGNWVQPFSSGLTTFGPSPGPAANAAGTSNTLTLVLDTTGAAWTVSAFINGTADGSFTYGTNPTIAAVGINWGTDATFTRVELSSVPEPATWGLLAGAGTVLVTLRRRKA